MTGPKAATVTRINVRGLNLTTATSSLNNSNIYLRNPEAIGCRPNQVFQIHGIIKPKKAGEESLLILHEYLPATGFDVYQDYPLLRAKTWSRKLNEAEVVVAVSRVRCHAAIWNLDEEKFVAVMLDRVRVI